ncbi:hypothetical protein EDB83DRAFT_2354643 [Lactarius deliciosus]|nr:hypothetical protein EDB83DRAFT_2354643 [Lactarius deliciosus]
MTTTKFKPTARALAPGPISLLLSFSFFRATGSHSHLPVRQRNTNILRPTPCPRTHVIPPLQFQSSVNPGDRCTNVILPVPQLCFLLGIN